LPIGKFAVQFVLVKHPIRFLFGKEIGMFKRLVVLIMFIFMIVSSTICEESPTSLATGNDYLTDCSVERPKDTVMQFAAYGHCMGYVQGFIDAMALSNSLHPGQPFFCFPTSGIRVEQMMRVIEKYLRDHPNELHMPLGAEVGLALAKGFPCKDRR
jgi:hypothetical protein